ncbi:MAG: TrmB family transcriptional regulator [Nanoarchaeota archaeon]
METKIEHLLKELEFTNAEATVYLSLLHLGESKVGEIIKHSGVSSSNTHDCLEKLFKKGIISYVIKNSVKYYYPAPPEALLEMVKKEQESLMIKQQKIKELIPKLSKIEKIKELEQNAEIFCGFNGLKTAYQKLCVPIHGREETYFFHKYDSETAEEIDRFFFKLDLGGDYKHIPARAIITKGYEKYLKKRKGPIKIKVTDYPIPSNLSIYHNKILLISWSKNPVGFLIESPQLTKIFANYFNELWEIL